MAAVFAPLEEVERIVDASRRLRRHRQRQLHTQAVIGGATAAVEAAVGRAAASAGHQPRRLPVSHAFHTAIVAPASEPLRRMLRAAATSRRPRSRSWPT